MEGYRKNKCPFSTKNKVPKVESVVMYTNK